ncbi:MAG: hypothetical protein AAF750_08475 [Planctomycetota bacterium]
MVLYGPLPVMTVGRWLDDPLGLPITSELQGLWHPAQHDPHRDTRAFACKDCWNIRGTDFATYRGWNTFITHLSNGLLFGRDVDHRGIIHLPKSPGEPGRIGPAQRPGTLAAA